MLGVNSVRSYVLDSSVWTGNVKSWYEEGSNAMVGYYTCTTGGGTAAKAVNDASGYVLSLGGSMKIKFTNKHTGNNTPTLNINGQGAKSIIYDGSICSSTNTWENGETVECYYDGSAYQLNNVAGGGTFKTGEKVKNVGIDSEPTNGSNNLVTSDGVQKEIALGAVYDVSAKNPTAGPNNDGKWESLSALLSDANLNTLIPTSVRKGGMSIKFVQSSDNKYVQYRLMNQNWSANTENWAIADEGVYIDNPDFIEVKLDKDNKILWAIKTDGDIYFGVGVQTQVKDYIQSKIEELGLSNVADIVTFLGTLLDDDKTLQELLDEKVNVEEGKALIDADVAEKLEFIENGEYLEVETDSDDKILGGRKANGTKFENVGNENPVCSEEYVKENGWLDITVDSYGRIIEGIAKDGKKVISDFDESTRLLIKQIANGGNLSNNKISIPLLDANFVSPVPCIIDGTKGDDDAKYSFTLPLQNEAYNIRFKFKITENILNQNKTSVIAKFGGANAVVATPVKLNQLLASKTYQGEVKTMYWPSLRGGISLNGSSVARTTNSGDKQNIGNFAFYVKYTGESTNVTIENTGNALIIKVDGVTTNLSFSTYQSVAELYEAIKSLSDFEVSYNELETRQCSELATFKECVLVSKYYTGVNGGKNDPIEEYYDTAPFFIPYAVSEDWHQVEIVKIGEDVYACVDGLTTTIAPNDNILSLGGECGCLFKDLEVDTTSSSDAEFIDGVLISSVNPHIIIHEGHDIIQTPTNEIVSPSGKLGTTVDRLQLVYSKMIGKGYVPVSIDEIADYYAGNRTLPKRCFTSIFDDYRWVNCLDLSNRSVFTRLGIKPGLAIITSDPSPIEHNGNTITPQEAASICRHYQFGLYSHTRSHRDNYNIKPSTYFSELTADVYDGDIKGIDNSILVYPYGHVYTYMTDVMKWLGFRLGIDIQRGGVNIKNRSRFNLTRIEIGVTEDITDIFNSII